MRRLRDKLVASTIPLIILLLAATWWVQANLIAQLSSSLADRVSNAFEDVEAISAITAQRLLGQARQINDSAALREALTTYLEAHKKAQAAKAQHLPASRLRELEETLLAAKSSLRDDVGPTEVATARLDLLVLIDLEGRVIASLRSPSATAEGAPPNASPESVTDHTDDDARASLADAPLVRSLLEGETQQAVSYMVYPDNRLYLAAATPLLRGNNVEGVLLLGSRRFIPPAGDMQIAYVSGDKVLDSRAPSSGKPMASRRLPAQTVSELQAWLRTWTPPAVHPPRRVGEAPNLPLVTLTLGERTFLSLPHPLWEMGRDTPVAWVLLMLPLDTLLQPVENARTEVTLFGFGVLVISALVVVTLAARITRPIEELSLKMTRVGEGSLDITAAVKGRDEVANLARSFNEMVDGLREKERLAAYVPEKARDAIADLKGRTALGAKRLKASVLFSDLRGFTTISEKLDPAEVVALLNEYLERMQAVISRHGGYVSDYVGDAVMAVFTEDPQEAPCSLRSVRCAVGMQDALADLRRTSLNVHLQGLRMGIGVNTGMLVEGDVGPATRLKYAVVGDTVNTASRIQDRSKDGRHTCVLVSAATREEIQDEFETVFFGDEMLKGKSASVAIWEIVGRSAPGSAGDPQHRQATHPSTTPL